MTCGDCTFVQPLLNFPSVLYFCCFVLFRSFFLNLDIFSGTHVRTCVQVATPLATSSLALARFESVPRAFGALSRRSLAVDL